MIRVKRFLLITGNIFILYYLPLYQFSKSMNLYKLKILKSYPCNSFKTFDHIELKLQNSFNLFHYDLSIHFAKLQGIWFTLKYCTYIFWFLDLQFWPGKHYPILIKNLPLLLHVISGIELKFYWYWIKNEWAMYNHNHMGHFQAGRRPM